METVFDRIERAGERELREIMDAVQDRFAVAYPQWDIVYLAVPKDDPNRRKEILQQAFDTLQISKK